MAAFGIVPYFLVMCISCVESSIVNDPIPDITSCTGRNITIGWEYDNLDDLIIAVWRFSNGSLTDEPILQKVQKNQPSKPNNSPIEVEFIGNGTVKLTNTDASYTGNYTFDITYTTASLADSDRVSVIIHDPPQVLTYQITPLNVVNCSGSPDVPTVIRVTRNGLQTSLEGSPYTSNNTNEGIECCYNGHAANCSSQTFNATYSALYCQSVRVGTVNQPVPTGEQSLTTGEIAGIVIAGLVCIYLILCCVLGVHYYTKKKQGQAVAEHEGEETLKNESKQDIVLSLETPKTRNLAIKPVYYSKLKDIKTQHDTDNESNVSTKHVIPSMEYKTSEDNFQSRKRTSKTQTRGLSANFDDNSKHSKFVSGPISAIENDTNISKSTENLPTPPSNTSGRVLPSLPTASEHHENENQTTERKRKKKKKKSEKDTSEHDTLEH